MAVRSHWTLIWPAVVLVALVLAGCQPRDAEAGHAAVGGSLPAVDIPEARTPVQGLLTGGQPTRDQLRQAAEMGFRSVINLRPDGEKGTIPNEAAVVADLGMRYFHIPIDGAKGLTEEHATLFSETLAEAGNPTMVHCASGNRVGALFSLKAFLVDGVSVEEAMTVGKEAGMGRLESATRKFLETRSTLDLVGSATPQ